MTNNEAEIVARLRESNRQQRMWLVVVVLGVVVAALIAIVALPNLRVGAPVALAGVGAALGVLITAPQRKMLAELGMTRQQAIDLLTRAENEGVTREQKIERNADSRKIWLMVTTVTTVVALVAIVYVFSQAGNRVDDNDPSTAMPAIFPVAVFGGAAALITAITGYVKLSNLRFEALLLAGQKDETAP